MAIYNGKVKQGVQQVPTIFKGNDVKYINWSKSKNWIIKWNDPHEYYFSFPSSDNFSIFRCRFNDHNIKPKIIVKPKKGVRYYFNDNRHYLIFPTNDNVVSCDYSYVTDIDTISVKSLD